MKEIGKVYEEIDYRKFGHIEGNRGCKADRAKKIKKSIEQNGFVMNPVVVNEKFEIIDGEGRFLALEELGMPIYFTIAVGAGIKECIALNESTTKWTLKDFINSYVSLGNESYKMLNTLIESHVKLPSSIITSVAYGVFTKVDVHVIQDGKFDITPDEFEKAHEILTELEKYADTVSKIPGRRESLLYALVYAIGKEDVNNERLYSRFLLSYNDVGQVADTIGALAAIERIYNRQLKNERIYLVSDYDKDLRQSNASYESRWGQRLNNRLSGLSKKYYNPRKVEE